MNTLRKELTLEQKEALKNLRIKGQQKVEIGQQGVYQSLVEKGLATVKDNPTEHLKGWADGIPERQHYLIPTRTYRAV